MNICAVDDGAFLWLIGEPRVRHIELAKKRVELARQALPEARAISPVIARADEVIE